MILYETERLIIRKWRENDYLDLYEYASMPETSTFLSFEPYEDESVAKERIAFLIEKYSNNEVRQDYAIELKAEKKVIGSIGFVEFSKRGMGTIEIGYLISPKYQHNGYMTEALKSMFNYIKKMDLAKRIVCKCDTENIKSANVMKRAGMTFEGIERKGGSNRTHPRCDLFVYSILYEEIDG